MSTIKGRKTGNPLSRFLLNRMGKDSVAYQVVLKSFPLSVGNIVKLLANGYSAYRSGMTSAYPLALNLESTAQCNLSCAMCPRTEMMTRDVGNMDLDLYKRIVDEVDPIFMTLAQFGEPLLHPGLAEMVDYATAQGRMVRITTNATVFKPEKLRELIRANITHILISFDSCNKETYEKIRVGAKFEQVVENIKTLIDIKKGFDQDAPIISFNVTLTKENVHEIPQMIKYCRREFGIAPTFSKSYTYGDRGFNERNIKGYDAARVFIKEGYRLAAKKGDKSLLQNMVTLYNDTFLPLTGYKPCFWPYYSTNVSWDGKVFPCCVYFDCQVTMGNLSQQPFKEVWNGSFYRSFRKGLLESRDTMYLCKHCELVDIGPNNMIKKAEALFPPFRLAAGRKFECITREGTIP